MRSRHPANTTPGTFNPAAVGIVRNYPATLEAYQARTLLLRTYRDKAEAAGTMTRVGVPNGLNRLEAERLRAVALDDATQIIRGVYRRSDDRSERPDPSLAPNSDASRGEWAMAACLAVVLGPGGEAHRRKTWDCLVSYLRAPGERPVDSTSGIKWLRWLARTGGTEAYQTAPVPGVSRVPTPFELEGGVFLGSLVAGP